MKYYEDGFFEQTQEKLFLVKCIGRLHICKLTDNKIWFKTSYGLTKASTIKCMPISDIKTKLVSRKDMHKVKGKFTGLSVGHFDIGVYWLAPIKTNEPISYFWNDINNLNIQ